MIVSKRADELRPGDILSTDGTRVESVVLCQGGGIEDEIAICRSYEDGTQKFNYVDPSQIVYVYVERE